MKLVALAMARDEADVIVPWVEHLGAEGVDRLIVADNLSTDGTRALLDDLAESYRWLTVIDDNDPAYHQSLKMSAMAARYCEPGDWCVSVDLDELWFATNGATLRDLFDSPGPVVTVNPFAQIPSVDDDSSDRNPFTRTRRRQVNSDQLSKVAFQWQPGVVIATGNHNVTGAGDQRVSGNLNMRHFQFRTLEQTSRKVRQGVAALKAANENLAHGSHWRSMAAMSDDELGQWWERYCSQPTVFDPAPWRSL